MLIVDWWSWKCARCGWLVKDERTVNYQRSIAEAMIRPHLKEHEEATPGDAGATKVEGSQGESAHDVLRRLQREGDRLREELETARRHAKVDDIAFGNANRGLVDAEMRAEAAEADASRLRGALRTLANARQVCDVPSDSYDRPCGCCQRAANVAKEALASVKAVGTE